ncbi:MAG: hypothetical protein AAGI28_03385 [Pseudomonadota bacterium]
MKNIQRSLARSLTLGASIVTLSACGADEIVSPGTSGDININNPAPTPTPTPTPTPGATLVEPAADCPTIASSGGLSDLGTITGPTGTYRACQLPSLFDQDDALPFVPGLLYAFSGRVDVGSDQGFDSTGTDVTLSIDPGVILYAATGQAFFNVNRGNALDADGTADAPIIFTSRDNVIGVATDTSDQQWGGITLLGRAPVSDCGTGGRGTLAVGDNCEQLLEGISENLPFGGDDESDSSGSLSFLQIRFSGFAIAPGNELQSLTAGGIGSGTTLSRIMSFNSFDDGLEFFGGNVNIDTTAVIGARDDSLDVDTGTQGNIQYALVAQRVTNESDVGDTSIELDSPSDDFPTTATPQTVLNVANFTFIQNSGTDEVINVRGGAQLNLVNGIFQANGAPCVAYTESVSATANNGSTYESVVGDCPDPAVIGASGASDTEAQAAFTGNNLVLDADVTFTSGFFFDASSTTAGDPTALSSFFTATSFIGALESESDTRFQGWTCDSGTIDFGTGNDCTSLPIRQGEG